ncbi:bactofilin family protein [Pedobacter cryophilus]|uniref:Polymer-forming cytoskeletal protein n=1 Tax=Pedobacter cryophilus TaxID=2571271 RepID=A0A4U1C9B2_9SPHI|nr:polymer-forming cytoskeletal protein [Pedobacter cryophilus]TKC00228.1 polymer-forming cytoskeletal protein [Pedobacter cryophilus]
MFKKKKEASLQGEQKAGSINIIGVGTEINGDLSTKGDVRIDGKIIGDVSSKAKVVIGTTGEVIGNIYSESAEISGSVNGNLNITEILFLKATANVKGNVASNKFVVENGANLTGHCETGITQTKSIIINNLDGREEIASKREASA